MRTFLAATALGLACLATSAPAADDDDLARARAEFETLVRPPTERARSWAGTLHDFLSRPPALVLRVEGEAWDAWHDPQRIAAVGWRWLAIENSVRFLHGLPPRHVRDFSGGQTGPGLRPLNSTFSELVAGHDLIAPPIVRAADLFAAVGDLKSAGAFWTNPIALGESLGEACATDDAAFAKLEKRAAATPDDLALLTALGWTGRAQAAALLEARVAAATPSADVAYGFHSTPFAVALAALAHADRARVDRILDGLPTDRADLVASLLGGDAIVLHRLAALERAKDADARRAALAALVRPVAWRIWAPRGRKTVTLVLALLEATDSGDAALRGAALAFAGRTLFGYDRMETSGDLGPGVTVGSCLDPERRLRSVAEDLAEGRVEFVPEEPGLFARCAPTPWAMRDGGRDQGDRSEAPVELAGERTRDGVLRLRNVGTTPLAVDPVALRYGSASRTTTAAGVKTARTESVLSVNLTGLRGAVVPARALVTLAPGTTYSWEIALRSELRPTTHVDVALDDETPVLGESATPVATCFGARVF